MSRTSVFFTFDSSFPRDNKIFVCGWILLKWVGRLFTVSFYSSIFPMGKECGKGNEGGEGKEGGKRKDMERGKEERGQKQKWQWFM